MGTVCAGRGKLYAKRREKFSGGRAGPGWVLLGWREIANALVYVRLVLINPLVVIFARVKGAGDGRLHQRLDFGAAAARARFFEKWAG